MNPSPLFEVSFDCGDGVHGVAVVDSLLRGTSSGGVRIAPEIHPDEVRALASEMTLKYGFFGLPRGGAKCGIQMPTDLEGSARLDKLGDVGRRLGRILQSGIYYPGMDMNCGEKELRAIYAGAGIQLPPKLTDTGYFTALFVAEAVEAARRVLFADHEGPVRLSIEGLGSVGCHLVQRLPRDAYRVVGVSTIEGAVEDPAGLDVDALVSARERHGDGLVAHLSGRRMEAKEDLLSLPTDILVPAARVGSIDASNVDAVQASCLVAAANAPCTESALGDLHERGVVVLPGFVCNAGGVFGSSLADGGVPSASIEELAAGPYRTTVEQLIQSSRATKRSPTDVARVAARHFLEQARAVQPSRWQQRLRSLSKRSRLLHRMTRGDRLGHAERHLAGVTAFLGTVGAEGAA